MCYYLNVLQASDTDLILVNLNRVGYITSALQQPDWEPPQRLIRRLRKTKKARVKETRCMNC
jgi:hypothetical protein